MADEVNAAASLVAVGLVVESEADAYFTSQNKMANFLHFEEWGNLAGVNEDP